MGRTRKSLKSVGSIKDQREQLVGLSWQWTDYITHGTISHVMLNRQTCAIDGHPCMCCFGDPQLVHHKFSKHK